MHDVPQYFQICQKVGHVAREFATAFSVTFSLGTIVGELVKTPPQRKMSLHISEGAAPSNTLLGFSKGVGPPEPTHPELHPWPQDQAFFLPRAAVLRLVGDTEPRKFHICIHRAPRSRKTEYSSLLPILNTCI